jgi:hypothetical protein
LPDHVALGGAGVETHPALEFVVGLRHDECIEEYVIVYFRCAWREIPGTHRGHPHLYHSQGQEGPGTSSGTDPEFHSLWLFWLETLENSARYGEELVSSTGFNCRSGSFAIIRKLNGDRPALDIIIVVVSVSESLFRVALSDL